jgi:hypothetical protein
MESTALRTPRGFVMALLLGAPMALLLGAPLLNGCASRRQPAAPLPPQARCDIDCMNRCLERGHKDYGPCRASCNDRCRDSCYGLQPCPALSHRPPPTSRPLLARPLSPHPLDPERTLAAQIGQRVTLRGKAAEAKAGAVIIPTGGTVPVYLRGLSSWGPALGKEVIAEGVLRREKVIPDPQTDPTGAVSQGARGEQYVLEDATWEVR